jgi:hypothetical protein
VTKEAMARQVAQVAGEMALALVRPVTDAARVRKWVDQLRRVADALEARIGGAG